MTGWAVYALMVIGGPTLLGLGWLVTDWKRERRRARLRANPHYDWSVAAIVARVQQERADEAATRPQKRHDAEWATDVLPEMDVDHRPTSPIPAVSPAQPRRYPVKPRPYLRYRDGRRP